MRISDWSSDVCSSDLSGQVAEQRFSAGLLRGAGVGRVDEDIGVDGGGHRSSSARHSASLSSMSTRTSSVWLFHTQSGRRSGSAAKAPKMSSEAMAPLGLHSASHPRFRPPSTAGPRTRGGRVHKLYIMPASHATANTKQPALGWGHNTT